MQLPMAVYTFILSAQDLYKIYIQACPFACAAKQQSMPQKVCRGSGFSL